MHMRFNVIDSTLSRRASICREILGRGFHAEIYDDLFEFLDRPSDGFVLIADDPSSVPPEDVFEEMRARGQALAVVFYSEQPRPEEIVRAMLAGALDYLRWPYEAHILDATIQRLMFAGEKLIATERRYAEARRRIGRLSPRELDVLRCLLKGLSNKEIGAELAISPRTVEIHRGNMMRKLDANSASDAVRMGLHARLDSDVPSSSSHRLLTSIGQTRGAKLAVVD